MNDFEKAKELTDKHVYCCVSSWMDNEFKHNDAPTDDIENLYGEEIEGEDEPTMKEVFEWYVVSDWLADKLAGQGQVVIREHEYLPTLWGRTTTGQAVYVDGVFQRILEAMV